jgi:hypothetical protein
LRIQHEEGALSDSLSDDSSAPIGHDEQLDDPETFDFDFTDFNADDISDDDDDDDDDGEGSTRRPRIVWAVDDELDRYTVDFDDLRTVTNHANLKVRARPSHLDELDADMHLTEIDRELAYLAEAEEGVSVESAVKALLDAKGGESHDSLPLSSCCRLSRHSGRCSSDLSASDNIYAIEADAHRREMTDWVLVVSSRSKRHLKAMAYALVHAVGTLA